MHAIGVLLLRTTGLIICGPSDACGDLVAGERVNGRCGGVHINYSRALESPPAGTPPFGLGVARDESLRAAGLMAADEGRRAVEASGGRGNMGSGSTVGEGRIYSPRISL